MSEQADITASDLATAREFLFKLTLHPGDIKSWDLAYDLGQSHPYDLTWLDATDQRKAMLVRAVHDESSRNISTCERGSMKVRAAFADSLAFDAAILYWQDLIEQLKPWYEKLHEQRWKAQLNAAVKDTSRAGAVLSGEIA